VRRHHGGHTHFLLRGLSHHLRDRAHQCLRKGGPHGRPLVAGLRASAKKYRLPFVIFNQGSICHLDTVGTMHFAINWKKPWELPRILKETGKRQIEMQHIGAAYMAEGIVTLAGSRLYTSAAYDGGDDRRRHCPL